jgi:hypothetical protein
MKLLSAALILVLAGAACNRTSPTAPSLAPPSGASPSASAAPPYTLSGTVFVTDAGPVAGIDVEIWAETARSSSGVGRVTTDAQGRYEVSGLDWGLVWIFAAYPVATRGVEHTTYAQPCAAAVRVDRNMTLDVELVFRRDPRPATVVRPLTIAGTVFETTPSGRVPLEGVRVFAEKLLDFVGTGAVSDAHGRYALCGLPSDQWGVLAVKDGYQMSWNDYSPLTTNRTLDIELRR